METELRFFFDENQQLRFLDPEIVLESQTCVNTVTQFSSTFKDWQFGMTEYLNAMELCVQEIENQQAIVVGLRSRLSAMSNENERQKQKIQNEIEAKAFQLQKLKVDHSVLPRRTCF